jgi:hypothetical protein
MPLADWLIPKPSLAAQAQLQHSICVLRAEGKAHIDATLNLTESLLRQNMHYHTLLNQAIHHISELELQQILTPPDPVQSLAPPPPSSYCNEVSDS